jgi:holo-[acyl-carrier protein] synthase
MTRLGIDVVEVERIKTLCQRYGERFLNRIYTPKEMAYVNSAHGNLRFERLAARFALKEAVIKAMGHPLPFSSIEVDHTPEGRLCVTCSLVEGKIEASLSHTRRLAVACILIDDVTFSLPSCP